MATHLCLLVLFLVQGALAATASADKTTAKLSGQTLTLQWSNPQGTEWKLAKVDFVTKSSSAKIRTPNSNYGIVSDLAMAAPNSTKFRRADTGNYTTFSMQNVSATGNSLKFARTDATGTYTALWTINSTYGFEAVTVDISWTPKSSGWFSLLSPTVATVDDKNLGRGVIPGYWSSSVIQQGDEELTEHWNIGVPKVPLITVEASTTNLVSILEDTSTKMTYAVVPDPSLARDPWQSNAMTQSVWQTGMSLRNFDGKLSPTGVYPILGQTKSRVASGSTLSARFWLVFSPDGWFEVNKMVAQKMYPLQVYLNRAKNLDSLSHRMEKVRDFVVTPESKWHLWETKGLIVGAESSKIADTGSMWMVDAISEDPIIRYQRLPYARNFKLAQQATDGPYAGAVYGEYALGPYPGDGRKTRDEGQDEFVSELIHANLSEIDYVAPVGTTFYTLSDMGNILLYNPKDSVLLSRLKLAADKLLSWQYANGSFAVGYVKNDPTTQMYPHLTDYRATWYGFIPAFKHLKDKKYLEAAEKGANWYIQNAVEKGNFLGVCDDTYIVRDFHVIFGAQALLDLYDLTKNEKYLHAAIQTAKFYTLQVMNHPAVDDRLRSREGTQLQGWQLSQVGMNFEHAGYGGSVNLGGPITLASHAGAFVRFYELTGEQLFLDQARAAARGRDAYVDPKSGISSYYWSYGNSKSSMFPWQGWWHIGWITDYLLSEAHLRSKGQIKFPQGFNTAKVGSHRPYGFQDGTIYGRAASLWMPSTLVDADQPDVDYVTAVSQNKNQVYIILLNESPSDKQVNVKLNPRGLFSGKLALWGNWRALQGTASKSGTNQWTTTVSKLGFAVIQIDLQLKPDPKGPEFRNFSITKGTEDLKINWQFWSNATSWAEWRVGTSKWASTPSQSGFNFTTAVDLSSIKSSSVDVRIASKISSSMGYSEPVTYKIGQAL